MTAASHQSAASHTPEATPHRTTGRGNEPKPMTSLEQMTRRQRSANCPGRSTSPGNAKSRPAAGPCRSPSCGRLHGRKRGGLLLLQLLDGGGVQALLLLKLLLVVAIGLDALLRARLLRLLRRQLALALELGVLRLGVLLRV